MGIQRMELSFYDRKLFISPGYVSCCYNRWDINKIISIQNTKKILKGGKMVKTKIISNGKLDITGIKKLGKSLLVSLGGAAILFIATLSTSFDFGGLSAYAVVFFPWLANVFKIWLGKYESA